MFQRPCMRMWVSFLGPRARAQGPRRYRDAAAAEDGEDDGDGDAARGEEEHAEPGAHHPEGAQGQQRALAHEGEEPVGERHEDAARAERNHQDEDVDVRQVGRVEREEDQVVLHERHAHPAERSDDGEAHVRPRAQEVGDAATEPGHLLKEAPWHHLRRRARTDKERVRSVARARADRTAGPIGASGAIPRLTHLGFAPCSPRVRS